jgi:hypothetical protein
MRPTAPAVRRIGAEYGASRRAEEGFQLTHAMQHLLRKGVYQISALLPDSRIKQYIQRPERTHELARKARRFSGRIGPQIG